MKKGMLFEAVAVLLFIALLFVLCLMVTTGGPSKQWALYGVIDSQDGHAYRNMFIGDNGTVYTVDGRNVHAIGPDGRIRWSLPISNLLNKTDAEQWIGGFSTTDGGNLYILLHPAGSFNHSGPSPSAELLAITEEGIFEWEKTYSEGGYSPNEILVKNGLAYVLSRPGLATYRPDGSEAWNVSGDYFYLSVDDNGTAYMLMDYINMSVVAITPDGKTGWNKSIESYGLGIIPPGPIPRLLYYDHTLYLTTEGGLLAINPDGSLKWKKSYGNMPSVIEPFDANGKLYLREGSRIFSVAPDGTEATIADGLDQEKTKGIIDVEHGIVYVTKTVSGIDGSDNDWRVWVPNGNAEKWLRQVDSLKTQYPLLFNRTLDQLDTQRVYAYDLYSGKPLWNYTLPLDKRNVVLSATNYRNIIPNYQDIESNGNATPAEWYEARNVSYGASLVNGGSEATYKLSDGILYASLWTYNFEVPTFLGQSNCTYGGGIYALDRNGTLLWSQQPEARAVMADARNGTVYYSTNDGGVFGAKADAAAGFALTAAAYLLIRFILAGAVTRAKSRINTNANRNTVLEYIAGNPGASLYEISRGLKMNKGTARYHLLILGLNHRITPYKADDKYVRYFTNSGTYSAEEQLVLSLARRDGIKKLLSALLEKPGLSNLELAGEAGMCESAALRYMKELVGKGVVARRQANDGCLSFTIRSEYRNAVASAVKRLADE